MCRELGFKIAADRNDADICVVTLSIER
jgi:hypothetical protein